MTEPQYDGLGGADKVTAPPETELVNTDTPQESQEPPAPLNTEVSDEDAEYSGPEYNGPLGA